MRKLTMLSSLLGAIVMIAMPTFAADIASVVNNKPENDNFQTIGVNELSRLMADRDAHVRIYDANGPGVRASEGMIPGARPLTSDDHYDVAQELPTNKNARIIFYCANFH
jgi:hypothetical protein